MMMLLHVSRVNDKNVKKRQNPTIKNYNYLMKVLVLSIVLLKTISSTVSAIVSAGKPLINDKYWKNGYGNPESLLPLDPKYWIIADDQVFDTRYHPSRGIWERNSRSCVNFNNNNNGQAVNTSSLESSIELLFISSTSRENPQSMTVFTWPLIRSNFIFDRGLGFYEIIGTLPRMNGLSLRIEISNNEDSNELSNIIFDYNCNNGQTTNTRLILASREPGNDDALENLVSMNEVEPGSIYSVPFTLGIEVIMGAKSTLQVRFYKNGDKITSGWIPLSQQKQGSFALKTLEISLFMNEYFDSRFYDHQLEPEEIVIDSVTLQSITFYSLIESDDDDEVVDYPVPINASVADGLGVMDNPVPSFPYRQRTSGEPTCYSELISSSSSSSSSMIKEFMGQTYHLISNATNYGLYQISFHLPDQIATSESISFGLFSVTDSKVIIFSLVSLPDPTDYHIVIRDDIGLKQVEFGHRLPVQFDLGSGWHVAAVEITRQGGISVYLDGQVLVSSWKSVPSLGLDSRHFLGISVPFPIIPTNNTEVNDDNDENGMLAKTIKWWNYYDQDLGVTIHKDQRCSSYLRSLKKTSSSLFISSSSSSSLNMELFQDSRSLLIVTLTIVIVMVLLIIPILFIVRRKRKSVVSPNNYKLLQM